MGHPTYHVNVIKLKWEIIWRGGLPHLSRLPHLPGVPHLYVNRPEVTFSLPWPSWLVACRVDHSAKLPSIRSAFVKELLRARSSSKVNHWLLIFVPSFSLISEYHDLYELQRKRLEGLVGKWCLIPKPADTRATLSQTRFERSDWKQKLIHVFPTRKRDLFDIQYSRSRLKN